MPSDELQCISQAAKNTFFTSGINLSSINFHCTLWSQCQECLVLAVVVAEVLKW